MSELILTYGGNALTYGAGGPTLVVNGSYDPYNPLDLPPKTMRFQFENASYDPTQSSFPWKSGSSWSQVSSSPNVWDYTDPDVSWEHAFARNNASAFASGTSGNVQVLGANTSGVLSLAYAFSYCRALTSLALFDTSDVRNINWVFIQCSGLTQLPTFDFSSVVTASAAFEQCTNLTGDITINLHSGRDLDNMFGWCSNITSVTITDIQPVQHQHGNGMFAECSSLRTVTMPSTTAFVDTYSMFYKCSSLTSVSLFDTSHAKDMHDMFRECYALTSVPFYDTSSATDLHGFLRACTSLTSVPLFDTSHSSNLSF